MIESGGDLAEAALLTPLEQTINKKQNTKKAIQPNYTT